MVTFNFKIAKTCDNNLARIGEITTPHGVIKTPAFIVVGTRATVKALTADQIKLTGAQAVLSNAYHLYLQPGPRTIQLAGGLASFMNWDGPTVTDSGGFQVLSLGAGYKKTLALDTNYDFEDVVSKKADRLAHISDDGVCFKSHIDGSKHMLNPEKAMLIQHEIGADIIFAFDECTSIMHPFDYHEEALRRTHAWAVRCLKKHKLLNDKQEKYQALYGVVQGANFEELRKQSASFMANLDFDGYGIGGAIEKQNLSQILQWTNNILPSDKPRHLLGLSEPDDIFTGIENGIDTFDCVAPARLARNASLYTPNGRITIRKNQYKNDFSHVVEGCDCYTCKNYTKSYLSHLFRAGERLAATLATIHNEYFIIKLVDQVRQSIIDEEFYEFKQYWIEKYYGLKSLK